MLELLRGDDAAAGTDEFEVFRGCWERILKFKGDLLMTRELLLCLHRICSGISFLLEVKSYFLPFLLLLVHVWQRLNDAGHYRFTTQVYFYM